MDSDVTRRHQEDKTPHWRRREHATTGVDQTPGLCPVTLSQRAARCWPSAGLRGGQLAVSSHVLWIVGGRLPLRGYRGPGPVRASVVLSQVLARSRGHTCLTLRGTGSVSSAILTISKVPEWHVGVVPGATEVAVRALWAVHVTLGAAHAGDENPSARSGSDFARRQQEPQSCCGETQSSFSICLAVNTQHGTAIESPTPVADKKLVASRRSTRRQEAQGKDGDTNVHSRVELDSVTWRTALFADANAVEPCPGRNE